MKKQILSPEAKAQKAAYDKEWRSKNKERVKDRREYLRKYYQENRERILQQQQEYAKSKPKKAPNRSEQSKAKMRERQRTDEQRAYERKRRINKRREVLDFLGGKCERCGIEDWRVLQLDHINGGGRKERMSGYNFSAIRKDVLAHGRAKYQVLCANCHALKMYEDEK